MNSPYSTEVKVVGLSFRHSKTALKPNDKVKLVPEPTNKFDPNALAVQSLDGEMSEKPYCEYTFGQFMCGEPVEAWGQFCEKHGGQNSGNARGYRWEAYTDDGNTYSIVELEADTLKELKSLIRGYHLTVRTGYGERIAIRALKGGK